MGSTIRVTRCYHAAVVHPTGMNLRTYAAHGFLGRIPRDDAALILHLLPHLGTLTLRTPRPAPINE